MWLHQRVIPGRISSWSSSRTAQQSTCVPTVRMNLCRCSRSTLLCPASSFTLITPSLLFISFLQSMETDSDGDQEEPGEWAMFAMTTETWWRFSCAKNAAFPLFRCSLMTHMMIPTRPSPSMATALSTSHLEQDQVCYHRGTERLCASPQHKLSVCGFAFTYIYIVLD